MGKLRSFNMNGRWAKKSEDFTLEQKGSRIVALLFL